MFGHSSWDTFRATTTSGNQVFHGFWNRVSSKTIDKWEVENPSQCGKVKAVVYVKEERFGGDEVFHYVKMYEYQDNPNADVIPDESDVQESEPDGVVEPTHFGGWKWIGTSSEKPYPSTIPDEWKGLGTSTKPVHPSLYNFAISKGLAVVGCTDANATNYDEDATCDDDSCECKDGYQKNDDGICEEIPPEQDSGVQAQGTATSVDGGANYTTTALLVGGVGLVGMLLILNKK